MTCLPLKDNARAAVRLSPLSKENEDAATALYLSAFPEEERRDAGEWLRLAAESPLFRLCQVTVCGTFAGILSYWAFPMCGKQGKTDFFYVEHFATLPSLRGNGLGAAALAAFSSLTKGRPVVLEVEPPLTETAQRRVGFYRRAGFELLDTPYIQPPYRHGGEEVPLRLMCTDTAYALAHSARVIATLHREVYGVR